MVAPARSAAYRALRAVQTGQRDLPSACAAEDAGLPDGRDRGLLREIVTGTLRWQRRLDHVLAHVARRDIARLDPEVLTILELSAYQLLHLTRVPASAVVDDAVTLTRGARKVSAAGFVNGVLRTLSRQRDRLPLPARPAPEAPRADIVTWLGITYAHPDWLVARWVERFGLDDAEAWLRFNTAVPEPTLRINSLAGPDDALQTALTRDDVTVRPGAWAPGAFIVESGDPQGVAAAGLVVPQDEGSQLVACLVDATPGSRVLDVCAAPGGKATAIAARLGETGLLVACDIRPRRMRTLAATVRTARADRVRLVQVGARAALPVRPVFDWVLVDAPCSGLGTVRRDPDIKWRRSADDLAAFAVTQRDILSRAAAAVRPGGRLVYATCSSEPEENEEVVASFLADHPDFSLVNLAAAPPAGVAPALIDAAGMLRTAPHRHQLEAFFGAVLARTTSSSR